MINSYLLVHYVISLYDLSTGLFLILCSAVDYNSLLNDENVNPPAETRRWFFISGLVLVAIGTGGIKANVGLFGAHQVQDLGPQAVQVFFNWFYWFINSGAMLAFSVVAYVQQNVSFTWGYLLTLLSMIVALMVLNLARSSYIYKPGQGSVLLTSLKICHQACCKTPPVTSGKKDLFRSARKQYGGDFDNATVDGVIAVLRVLPIFFFIIVFWMVYAQVGNREIYAISDFAVNLWFTYDTQMETTYFLQGERMDLSAGDMKIPVAMLNLFNGVVVLVLIPILDRFIFLCFQRLHWPLSYMHRIGIGLVFSACSVFFAGWVEIERKKHFGFNQVVGEETFYASNRTVFLQIPQYVLIGAGEAFTATAGYEFAYTQAPDTMQGLITGLYLATVGLGSYLSTAIIALIEVATQDDPWFPDEINDGSAEYLFFVFGAITMAFFVGYLPAAYAYEYKEFIGDCEQEETTPSSDELSSSRNHDGLTLL
ncbi:hypothetical protein Btru_067703 [Bulinus truncatus]|nr:hypothetical protein Btru_067703 [Bulinus truncatus]